ncbi:Nn.00g063640.m01.CDS01 [Neocucurbitaria sp. VM-36]
MSALDHLSVAANVFQVINFADTVFHAGKILYELIDKARSATRSITLLLLELQALLSVVAYVHVVITEHASSPFAQDDGHALPNVHAILTLIEQDFLYLRGLLDQTARSRHEGWLSLLQSNVRWALKDHDIAAARHRLARYTQNLNAALSVSGRRNDIVLRTKLQNIEDRLRAISQANPPRLPNSELSARPPSSRALFRVQRRQVRVSSTPIPPRSNAQNSLIIAASTSHPVQFRQNEVVRPNSVIFNDPRISSFSHAYPRVNIFEQEDQTLIVDTGNYGLHQITKSVLILRDSLIESLSTMRTKGATGISEPQIEQLQMLFDSLIASAHTASAEAIAKKYGSMSLVKLLDGNSTVSKSKGNIIRKRDNDPISITKGSLPIYLEEKAMKLDTTLGSVDAKLLSARSIVASTTIEFNFWYYGNAQLSLSPFAVHFKSPLLSNKCGFDLVRSGLPGLVASFLPTVITSMHGAVELASYVSRFIQQWGNAEITIYMTCGQNLPRMPIKVYEFVAKDPDSLVQFQYIWDPITRTRTFKKSPPLGMVYIDHTDEAKYSQYINVIVDSHLEAFGEVCWMEDDHDFAHKLFSLMIHVQPRGKDEAGLLREVYRLIVVTFIMGHVITIAEETKESVLSSMESYTGPETYVERFCSPRVANRQLKYCFFRLQTSILTALLSKLQKVFQADNGYDKWVYAFIAILGLAMASEDQQKTIHYAMMTNAAIGLTTQHNAQTIAYNCCIDIDAHISFIQQIFRWKYHGEKNPLRDPDFYWDKVVGFEDRNSVDFVRSVAALVKDNVDFLCARQNVGISTDNVTKYTSRLVARFLLSFWLPE